MGLATGLGTVVPRTAHSLPHQAVESALKARCSASVIYRDRERSVPGGFLMREKFL